ncbi:hypothetical protein HYZ41_01040 [archaeon]|nr:hypothetical protein [archaeon]
MTSPLNDELHESNRIDKRKKRNGLIGKTVTYVGLTALGISALYSIYKNLPETRIKDYEGEWVPVVTKYDDRIWNIARDRGAGEYISSWCDKIIEKNKERDFLFNPTYIQIGDTIWIPKDMTIK